MRVLIACEHSGVVRDAFLRRGHAALSCDLLPSETPGPHYQGDVRKLLVPGWDLIIAHPPCTYITLAAVRHLYSIPSCNGVLPEVHGQARRGELLKAVEFFRLFLDAPCDRIAVENPVPCGVARQHLGDYTQLIQPWQFGHAEKKGTCLWLKNLPPLEPSHVVLSGIEAKCHMASPGPERWKVRSKTFQGIADAMAEQWGTLPSNSDVPKV